MRFKRNEGKELEKSDAIVIESDLNKTDPREVCHPDEDFSGNQPIREVNRADGVMFESLELDYCYKFVKQI